MIVEPQSKRVQQAAGPPAAPAYGSDVVVDLLTRLGIEYAAFNPGASFRGLHDSLVNHAGPDGPKIVTCCHEEIAVAVAHGYAKASGKPMAAVLHDVVGLQHACMAIYNAWIDRVPILLLGGTGPVDHVQRRPWIDWIHTALVQGNHIRDFVKWDDQPASLPATVESILRAYRLMLAEPQAPVYVCLDAAIQEDPIRERVELPDDVAAFTRTTRPQADLAALSEAADWLVGARFPVILADRVGRSAAGAAALVELAEALAAPVVEYLGTRFNFPSNHPLDATGTLRETLEQADMVLACDVVDLYGTLRVPNAKREPGGVALRPGTRLIEITVADLLTRSWVADVQRPQPVDLSIVADTSLALPALAGLVRERVAAGDPVRQARRAAQAAAHADWRAGWERDARQADGSPIALSRLSLELREALRGEDWVLSNSGLHGWVRRLWDLERPDQYLGGSNGGGGGLGYGIGASIGAALAHRGTGRVVVDIQPDGDVLYCTSALWTVANQGLPLLIVVYNNRSYYNSEEHQAVVARHRGRPVENAGLGTRVEQPAVDFAAVARGFGIPARGPISDPSELGAALRWGIEQVRDGSPTLIDVVTQPR